MLQPATNTRRPQHLQERDFLAPPTTTSFPHTLRRAHSGFPHLHHKRRLAGRRAIMVPPAATAGNPRSAAPLRGPPGPGRTPTHTTVLVVIVVNVASRQPPCRIVLVLLLLHLSHSTLFHIPLSPPPFLLFLLILYMLPFYSISIFSPLFPLTNSFSIFFCFSLLSSSPASFTIGTIISSSSSSSPSSQSIPQTPPAFLSLFLLFSLSAHIPERSPPSRPPLDAQSSRGRPR